MPARRIRVDPAAALRDGFEAIRREAGVPDGFPADVQAEAAAAAARAAGAPKVDLPFVTVDPPGSRDLEQAGAVERGVMDLVEAVVLAGREGERFDAVVIDEGLVQLRDPAVRARGSTPRLRASRGTS